MALQNQNISKANPDVAANREFINAVYQEAQGRYATDAEVADLQKRGLTSVKDVSNVVLGAANSPFYGGAAVKPQNMPAQETQPGQAPSPQQATFINNQGKKVVVDVADKARQQSLESQGYSLMGADDKPVGGTSPEQKPISEQNRFTDQGIDQLTGKEAGEGIQQLVEGGQIFNETDAKNYAFSISDPNWHQYVGATGGQRNPLYIGSTQWKSLQNVYTPYQLEQSTQRTSYGAIMWRDGVNINDIPREPASDTINNEVDLLSGLIGDAKGLADLTLKDSEKTKEGDYSKLGLPMGESSVDLYNSLYNTPEMMDAQTEVNDLKAELDEFDQQLDELRNDIRKEVEGEASESYITAKTTIRGEDILKQRRQKQREYETSLGNYNALKENAGTLLELTMHDNEMRYNRMFSELQFISQRQDSQFNKDMAMTEVALRIPEGRSITLPNGTEVNGLAENDNLNVVQFTDADRNNYVIGIDKATGQQVYKTFIGQSPSPAGAAGYIDRTPWQTLLGETTAKQSLEWMTNWNERVESGEIGTETTEDGKAYYFDKKLYDEKRKEETDADRWWKPTTYGTQVKPEDYFISYIE